MKFLVLMLLLAAAPPALAARAELGAASESALPSAPAFAAPAALAPLGAAPLAPALTAAAAPGALLAAPAAAPIPLAAAAAPAAVPAEADAPAAFAAAGADASPAGVLPAAAAETKPQAGLRAQLAQLAVGLDRAAAPGAPAGADAGALSRFWDFVNDRHPAATRDRLQARLEAGRAFLRESLRDPAISARVASALRATRAIAPAMNVPGDRILARLRQAVDGGATIRVASPNEARVMGPKTDAAAVTYPDGRVEIHANPGAAALTRAPPALLASTLLHELVHSEFGLGEYAAYFVETAYYLQLVRLVPSLAADPAAALNEEVRRDVFRGDLTGMIFVNYGDKLLGQADDVAALERAGARERARVAAALDDVAALEKAGRWERMADKAEWLAKRLPKDDDRRFYFALLDEALAELPDGTPYSAVFARAAAAARAPASRAPAPNAPPAPRMQAHLDRLEPRAFARRVSAAPSDGGVSLDGLRTAGFAALPPYALLDLETESAALAEIDSRYAPEGRPWATFVELSRPPTLPSAGETRWDDAKHARLNALLRPFVERLTTAVNRALRGERVKVRDVQLRLETKARAADVGIHVDLGGYVTATYALRGDGTDLYLTGPGGAVRVIRGPPHTAAIVTNKEREWATGIPGTVHAAPALGLGKMRVVLIVRFYRPGREEADMPRELSTRLDETLKQRAARVRQALARRSAPADDGGLLGFLRRR